MRIIEQGAPLTLAALHQGDDGTWHTAGERPVHWAKAAA